MPILSWLTRDDDIRAAQRVPYRLLEEAPTLSAGDPAAGNMLIQGDNLDALKALLPLYAGQVNCIYIDPPYNTRSAFEHYDDNLENSKWLATLWPRLVLLRDFLAEDGSIWVSIDNGPGALSQGADGRDIRQKELCDDVCMAAANHTRKPQGLF
jgi:adenine-specific DNA-methyltransferase